MDMEKTKEFDFIEILRETDKAWQVKFDNQTIIWVPKSQARITGKKILLAKWFVEAKGL